MTPTQAESHERHKAFHAAIKRKAAELADNLIVESLEAECLPADPQPPKALPPIPNERIREASNFAAEVGRGFSEVITIMRAVSAHTGVSIALLKAERKTKNIVRPRQYVYYLGKKLTTASMPQIGRHLGKDHTSVLAGIRKIEHLRQIDPKVEADLQAIAALLGGDID